LRSTNRLPPQSLFEGRLLLAGRPQVRSGSVHKVSPPVAYAAQAASALATGRTGRLHPAWLRRDVAATFRPRANRPQKLRQRSLPGCLSRIAAGLDQPTSPNPCVAGRSEAIGGGHSPDRFSSLSGIP